MNDFEMVKQLYTWGITDISNYVDNGTITAVQYEEITGKKVE